MSKKTKKTLMTTAIVLIVMIIILNIPVVSDVIAMTRVGWIEDVVKMEKAEYEGEEYWVFVLNKLDENDRGTQVIVTDHSISGVTVRLWEPLTGITAYARKPLFGTIYQMTSDRFKAGEEPLPNYSL